MGIENVADKMYRLQQGYQKVEEWKRVHGTISPGYTPTPGSFQLCTSLGILPVDMTLQQFSVVHKLNKRINTVLRRKIVPVGIEHSNVGARTYWASPNIVAEYTLQDPLLNEPKILYGWDMFSFKTPSPLFDGEVETKDPLKAVAVMEHMNALECYIGMWDKVRIVRETNQEEYAKKLKRH